MAREALRELAAQAHPAGENGFSFGVLYARDAAQAARIEEQLPELWAAAWTPRNRRWLADRRLADLRRGRARLRGGRATIAGVSGSSVSEARDAVADLRRIAFLLERAHESTYRVRAFRTAAAVLSRRGADELATPGPHRRAGPAQGRR